MGTEIERKFLVHQHPYTQTAPGMVCKQGYMSSNSGCTVRVRIMDNIGYLTIKGKGEGLVRSEYEYEIPLDDASEMLEKLCKHPLIEKVRYKVPYEGFIWEIDHFEGANAGLVVAEIELSHEDQLFTVPPWIGDEVTGDKRYFNSMLQQTPYTLW